KMEAGIGNRGCGPRSRGYGNIPSFGRLWRLDSGVPPCRRSVVANQRAARLHARREAPRRFHGGWIATKSEARVRLLKPLNLETTMLLDHPSDGLTAIRTHIAAIFVSLELSRSTWLVTSLSPGKGERMSRHSVTAGDMAELLALFAGLRRKAEVR